jgi:hypothetical protein
VMPNRPLQDPNPASFSKADPVAQSLTPVGRGARGTLDRRSFGRIFGFDGLAAEEIRKSLPIFPLRPPCPARSDYDATWTMAAGTFWQTFLCEKAPNINGPALEAEPTIGMSALPV